MSRISSNHSTTMKLMIVLLLACLWLPAGAYADGEDESPQRVLNRCAEELAEVIAPGATLHLVCSGPTKIARYTSAMLGFVLEARGYGITEATAPARPFADSESMEEPPASIFEKSRFADDLLLIDLELETDANAVIDLYLWDVESRELKRGITRSFSVSAGLQELGGIVPESPPRDDLPWLELFGELVPACDLAGKGPERGWRLREGKFYFRNGYWRQAAESFAGTAHEAVTESFFYEMMAIKYGTGAGEVLERVDDMLKLHPDSGPLYALKAWMTFREGRSEDAAMILEQARLSDVAREGLYIFAEYLLLLQDGRAEAAEEPLLNAVEAMPDTAFIQLQAARHYWRRADLDEAVRFFRRAIGAGADDAGVYIELGMALSASGESGAAIEAFMEVFRHRRGDLSVARRLSSMLRSAGRYEDALRVLAECVEANPEAASPVITLGDLYVYGWRIEESVGAYKKALQRDSSSGYAKVALACSYLLKRESDKAIDLLGRSLENDQRDARTLLMLGEALLHRGQIDEAIENLVSAAKDSEYEHMARIALSNALLQSGEPDRAIREAQLAVSSQPDSLAFAALARALMEAGRFRDTRQAIEKGLKSTPDSPDLRCAAIELKLLNAQNAGSEAKKNELYAKAVGMSEDIIRTAPFHLEAYLLGGYSALEMGDFELCAQMWKSAAELDRWDPDLAWQLARIYYNELESPEEAAPYFQRHIELGGDYADEAAGYLEGMP